MFYLSILLINLRPLEIFVGCFYVSLGEDMQMRAERSPFFHPDSCLLSYCFAQRFAQLTTHKESQQKETSIKCCSICASLVMPGSVSCADRRFQVGFILPGYHPPHSTEDAVAEAVAFAHCHSQDSRSFHSLSPMKHPSIVFCWQINLFPLSAWLSALFFPHRFRIKKAEKGINLPV